MNDYSTSVPLGERLDRIEAALQTLTEMVTTHDQWIAAVRRDRLGVAMTETEPKRDYFVRSIETGAMTVYFQRLASGAIGYSLHTLRDCGYLNRRKGKEVEVGDAHFAVWCDEDWRPSLDCVYENIRGTLADSKDERYLCPRCRTRDPRFRDEAVRRG